MYSKHELEQGELHYVHGIIGGAVPGLDDSILLVDMFLA